jgi:hypothetical protein
MLLRSNPPVIVYHEKSDLLLKQRARRVLGLALKSAFSTLPVAIMGQPNLFIVTQIVGAGQAPDF